MIKPGAWLGLLGGGQLGRMFVMAAQSLGYKVVVLDPDPASPAGRIAEKHVCSQYDDVSALDELGNLSASFTTEFENIPSDSLRYLEKYGQVSPSAGSVEIAQDRIREKDFLKMQGFQVVPYKPIQDIEEIDAGGCEDIFPGILKVSRFGYDGKGQARVNNVEETKNAFKSFRSSPCVLENMVTLAAELSVIVARDKFGSMSVFPAAENRHKAGILDMSIVPARLPDEIISKAKEIACSLAEKMNYVGVLCVEFFLESGDSLLINEIAPRPHNSGHYTIDACAASQFEQQARIVAGLPLGSTDQHCPAVMLNLLGDLWDMGEPNWLKVLEDPNVKLHLYGKTEPRRGRKMGHLTMIGTDIREILDSAEHIKKFLRQGIS